MVTGHQAADEGVLQTPDNLKSSTCEEAFNPNGLAQRSIAILKDTFPDIEVHLPHSLRAHARPHPVIYPPDEDRVPTRGLTAIPPVKSCEPALIRSKGEIDVVCLSHINVYATYHLL